MATVDDQLCSRTYPHPPHKALFARAVYQCPGVKSSCSRCGAEKEVDAYCPVCTTDDAKYRDENGKLDSRKFPGLHHGCPNRDTHDAHIWDSPNVGHHRTPGAFCYGQKPPAPPSLPADLLAAVERLLEAADKTKRYGYGSMGLRELHATAVEVRRLLGDAR